MISSHEREVRPGWKELGRFLLASDSMAPDWVRTFEAVDRATFLPDVMWPFDQETGTSRTVAKADDPAGWLRWADTNVPITTQWDDGSHSGPEPGQVATSSASMPSVVMSMLRDLDVHEGLKVLEIGTGTGWNAALLAHRLGDRNVTTVEVDPAVTQAAREALRRADLRPYVFEDDGFLGYRPNAPYDRVIVTCGLRTIAPAWMEQTRPGGLLLVPWGTPYSNQDAVARLVVQDDGTAAGHFTGPVQFMKMRSQRLPWPQHAEYVPDDWMGIAERSSTKVRARQFNGGPYDVAEFVTGLQVQDCAHAGGEVSAWFYGLTDKSWAAVKFATDDAPGEVYQWGSRRLWNQVEAATAWWAGQGRPGLERFGLTAAAEGQTIWLDSPTNPVPTRGD